jgi:hypothetical protein
MVTSNLRLLIFPLAAFGLLGSAQTPVEAATIAVHNFSFDTPSLAPSDSVFEIDSWVISGTGFFIGAVFNPEGQHFPGADGAGALPAPALGAQTALILVSPSNTLPSTGTLTTASALTSIASDTTYTLTIALGSRGDVVPSGGATATLSLLANGIPIPGASTLVAHDEANIPMRSYVDFSASFTTSGFGPLVGQSLTAQVTYSAPTFSQVMIDNVRLSAVSVPEPTTALLVCSIFPFLFRRRGRGPEVNR